MFYFRPLELDAYAPTTMLVAKVSCAKGTPNNVLVLSPMLSIAAPSPMQFKEVSIWELGQNDLLLDALVPTQSADRSKNHLQLNSGNVGIAFTQGP